MIDKIKLTEITGREHVLFDVPLASYTTFRIGGPADALVLIPDEEVLRSVLAYAEEQNIPTFFLGKGSNVLVNDEGFRGIVLTPGEELGEVKVLPSQEGENFIRLEAGCGASLYRIARTAMENSLTGLEFASGIPGSLGGAIYMNAGAYGGEMVQVLETITYLDAQGVHTMDVQEAELSYRHSCFMGKPGVILKAVLKLVPGDQEKIRSTVAELAQKRREKQPLEFPSAGSTFKRPEGYFAGKLIQDAGLSGYQVGGAQVSPKHCGFVVNVGGATAKDVAQLVRDVHEKVKETFGVEIWPEIRYLGTRGVSPENKLWN